MTGTSHPIDLIRVKESIEMIKSYVQEVDTTAVIEVLEKILVTPEDDTLKQKLSDSLQPLGISQGAVLNYAPYLAILILDNSMGGI